MIRNRVTIQSGPSILLFGAQGNGAAKRCGVVFGVHECCMESELSTVSGGYEGYGNGSWFPS